MLVLLCAHLCIRKQSYNAKEYVHHQQVIGTLETLPSLFCSLFIQTTLFCIVVSQKDIEPFLSPFVLNM